MVGLQYCLSVNNKSIPEPVELMSHPLRDIWLLRGVKWSRTEEAVAWEELEEPSYMLPKDVKATLCLYRRSSLEYRRSAEAEAELQYEAFKLRNGLGDFDYNDDS